jgi:hypothetical protein
MEQRIISLWSLIGFLGVGVPSFIHPMKIKEISGNYRRVMRYWLSGACPNMRELGKDHISTIAMLTLDRIKGYDEANCKYEKTKLACQICSQYRDEMKKCKKGIISITDAKKGNVLQAFLYGNFYDSSFVLEAFEKTVNLLEKESKTRRSKYIDKKRMELGIEPKHFLSDYLKEDDVKERIDEIIKKDEKEDDKKGYSFGRDYKLCLERVGFFTKKKDEKKIKSEKSENKKDDLEEGLKFSEKKSKKLFHSSEGNSPNN